jgi:hypothetical protein
METDVRVRNEGSIVMFTPVSDAAKTWFDENVHHEVWQWFGESLCVEWRYAEDLIEGLLNEGLIVGAL